MGGVLGAGLLEQAEGLAPEWVIHFRDTLMVRFLGPLPENPAILPINLSRTEFRDIGLNEATIQHQQQTEPKTISGRCHHGPNHLNRRSGDFLSSPLEAILTSVQVRWRFGNPEIRHPPNPIPCIPEELAPSVD